MSVPIFQPSPTPLQQRSRHRLEDAFVFLIQNAAEGDFTRLYDALDELKFTDIGLWRALRAHRLTRVIFDLVDAEDQYRQSVPLHERRAAK